MDVAAEVQVQDALASVLQVSPSPSPPAAAAAPSAAAAATTTAAAAAAAVHRPSALLSSPRLTRLPLDPPSLLRAG